MNIRVGTVFITQGIPHLPMPICTGTITPAKPNAQYKPRKSGKQYCYQVQLSCFGKSPAYCIKQRKSCMKNKEEDIKKLVPHGYKINKCCSVIHLSNNNSLNCYVFKSFTKQSTGFVVPVWVYIFYLLGATRRNV